MRNADRMCAPIQAGLISASVGYLLKMEIDGTHVRESLFEASLLKIPRVAAGRKGTLVCV